MRVEGRKGVAQVGRARLLPSRDLAAWFAELVRLGLRN